MSSSYNKFGEMRLRIVASSKEVSVCRIGGGGTHAPCGLDAPPEGARQTLGPKRRCPARRPGTATLTDRAGSVRLAGQDFHDSDLAQPAHRHGDVAVPGRHHVTNDAAAALRDLEGLELLGVGSESDKIVRARIR